MHSIYRRWRLPAPLPRSLATIGLLALGLAGCEQACENIQAPDLSSALARELATIKATHEQEQKHLATFDDLPDALKRIAEAARPHYGRMAAYRLAS